MSLWLCSCCMCMCVCLVCVIVWLSQQSHELFGPASGTKAGFVQSFSVISSHNCMRSHTQTQNGWERETEEMKMQRLNGIRYGGRQEKLRPNIQDNTDNLHFALNTEFFHLIWCFPKASSVIQSYQDVPILTARCFIFCSNFFSLLTAQLLNGIFQLRTAR